MEQTGTSWHHAAGRLRRDAFASVVVFLIALPFSMGVALACRAPISSALLPGAFAAIVAGLLGGAPFVVTGPAASVAVLVFEVGDRHGLAAIGAATLTAGLLQLALGSLRVARLAAGLPPPVVHGMLASIGMLMAAGQLAVAFGNAPAKSFLDNVMHLPHHFQHGNWQAAGIAAITFAVLLAWPRLPLRSVPASLVAIVVATGLTAGLALDVPKIELPGGGFQISWPQLPSERLLEWFGAAIAIGLIASTESLLSAVAVDELHAGPRARLNRELLGQGAANVVSGLLGGLPVTGGSVRSTANLQAKASGRASTVLHGVWLVLAATLMGDLLQYVPLAALAALLVLVSLRLVNLGAAATYLRQGHWPAYATTITLVLCKGLLWGIACGLAVHFATTTWRRAFAAYRQQRAGP